MGVVVWGIPTCGTVKKARAALEVAGISFVDRDLRAAPPSASDLERPTKHHRAASPMLYAARNAANPLVNVLDRIRRRLSLPPFRGHSHKTEPESNRLVYQASMDHLALALRAVVPALSKDVTRSHITCVQVMVVAGRCSVSATDGHRLHKASFETAHAEMSACYRLGKNKLGLRTVCSVDDQGRLQIVQGDAVVVLSPQDVVFPPVDQVIPRDTQAIPLENIRVNSGYMVDALEAASLVMGAGQPSRFSGPLLEFGQSCMDPVVVRGDNPDLTFIAIVMPMRT